MYIYIYVCLCEISTFAIILREKGPNLLRSLIEGFIGSSKIGTLCLYTIKKTLILI